MAGDSTWPICVVNSNIYFPGFGQRISWQGDSEDVPNGHRMTFKDTIHTISSDIFWKLVFPDSLLFLTTRLRRLRVACEELQVYMREMIAAKRASKIKSEQCDLFSNLLEANEEPDWREIKLNDTELIGNIFVFLVAGHEVGMLHARAFVLNMDRRVPTRSVLLWLCWHYTRKSNNFYISI